MDERRARELLETRADDLRRIARATDERGSLGNGLPMNGESSTTEQAELATETIERELDQTVREQAQASLRDVERALERVAEGTYGTCRACGERIADERLEAKPEAEYCVEHQPR